MKPDNDPQSSQKPVVQGVRSHLKLIIVFAVLFGGMAFLMFGTTASDALVYSKLVDEVVRNPSRFQDKELRVEGQLKPGSIKFREKPCEWRFSLMKNEEQMNVRFPQCIVPDTFRDGMDLTVTVQGRVDSQGQFLANQVIPRCPSKYEMKQRKENGEKMPHAEDAFGKGAATETM